MLGQTNKGQCVKLGLACAAVALIMVAIWQYFLHQKQNSLENASAQYEMVMKALKQKDAKKAGLEAENLLKLYPKTAYAPLSALILARLAIDQNNTVKAIEYLKLAIKDANQGPLLHIATVRLARVLSADDQNEEALKLLNAQPKIEAYVTLYEEIKGDIYFKQNQIAKAKEAYLTAIKAAPQGVPTMALQLKYNDLNGKKEES